MSKTRERNKKELLGLLKSSVEKLESTIKTVSEADSEDEVELSADALVVLRKKPEEICKVKKKSGQKKSVNENDSVDNRENLNNVQNTLMSRSSRSTRSSRNSQSSNYSRNIVSDKIKCANATDDSGTNDFDRLIGMGNSKKNKDSVESAVDSDTDDTAIQSNDSSTKKNNDSIEDHSEEDSTLEANDTTDRLTAGNEEDNQDTPLETCNPQHTSESENETENAEKKDNSDIVDIKLPIIRIVPLKNLLTKERLTQLKSPSDCIELSSDDSDYKPKKSTKNKTVKEKSKKRKRDSDSDESLDSYQGSKYTNKTKKDRSKFARNSQRAKPVTYVYDSKSESEESEESDDDHRTKKEEKQDRQSLSRRRNVVKKNSEESDDAHRTKKEEKQDRQSSSRRRNVVKKDFDMSKIYLSKVVVKTVNVSLAKLPRDMNKLLKQYSLSEIRDVKQNIIASKLSDSSDDDVPISLYSKNKKTIKSKEKCKNKKNDESSSEKSKNNTKLSDTINSILEDYDNNPEKSGEQLPDMNDIIDSLVNENNNKLEKSFKEQNAKLGDKKNSDSSISSTRKEGPNKKQNQKRSDKSNSDSSDDDEFLTPIRKIRNQKKGQRISDDSDNSENDTTDAETSTRKMRKKAEPVSTMDASDSNDSNDSNDENSDDRPSTSKRKKNNSDSEDFELDGKKNNDSDSDEFEPVKRRRIGTRNEKGGKKKESDDDDEDDEDYGSEKKKKKRRRRIKNVTSDSSDDDDEKGKKKGRKNIRKVLKNDDLEDETKRAAREEQERKKRIEGRQKLYNQMYDVKLEEVKELEKLILDFDEETKEELVTLDKKLVKKLKPHQASGIKFMYDACFESIEKIENSTGGGCILAHCMGLGKTLQVVALVHTLLAHEQTRVEKVLIICPVSTVLNWVNEFNIWLRHCSANKDIEIYEISKYKQNNERAFQINSWHNDGGVLIMGYDMFRNLSSDNKRIRKKIRDQLQQALVDPGPDLVVCDEGHLLKNSKTSLSKAVNQIRTLRRIVLTGTPLQNNLNEYYCMVQFVKPNLLGKYNEYCNRFVNPITNGQYTDSTLLDIHKMKRRSHILHKLLDACVQRRDYSVLTPFLPPKNEFVVYVRLTKIQCELYKYYMENKARRADSQASTRSSVLFSDFQNLQRIWTHPRVLRYNSDRYEINAKKKRDMQSDDEEGSLKDFIDDDEDSLAESTSMDSSSSSDDDDVLSVNSDDKKNKKKELPQVARRTRANAKDFSDPEPVEEIVEENPTEWWMPMCPEEELDNLEHSGKLLLLFSLLKECESIGDKILVFSQSLFSLDVIEHFLRRIDENTQDPSPDAKLADHTGSWSPGLDYFRLDGSTSIENRNAACKSFNREDNTRARLFLISTRAGGLGINLTAANRVIIFDVSWNPSHDIQSIFRVYRFGQFKPCYVYRFIALGTMEEKIYERQVTKLAIAKRVIDEHQIDRHYKENDLMELYKNNIEPEEERQTPAFPKKDPLFAEQLQKFDHIIYKYHEHDSLLENKHEETLSKEEIKAAWTEYESEKNRPTVAQTTYTYTPRTPGTGPVTSNHIFGFRSDVLLQLLNLKARRDYPLQAVGVIVPALLKQLYETMQDGDTSCYQDLLNIQAQMANQSVQFNNYNNINAAGSSNMVMNSFSQGDLMRPQQQLPQQQQLIKDAQTRLINSNNGISAASTDVIEID